MTSWFLCVKLWVLPMERGIIMRYTPFGEFFKILRIKHKEVLHDASDFLHVSSAYISAVECGKRAVPSEWRQAIIDHYDLSEKEIAELDQSIEMSKMAVGVNLSGVSDSRRAAALQFCRSFDEMDDDVADKILKILEENKKNGL